MSSERIPVAGEVWRSLDPRDNGLEVEVLQVWAHSSHQWVRIQRYRKTNVGLHRFHRAYTFVREARS